MARRVEDSQKTHKNGHSRAKSVEELMQSVEEDAPLAVPESAEQEDESVLAGASR